MPSIVDLRLNWCSHQAAQFACRHWHYSRSMPCPPLVRVGVWESGEFIGVVLFGRGASPQLGHPFGLTGVEVCELTRVALRTHQSTVSRIVGVAIKMLKKKAPGLRLIVSFADPLHGHVGRIYQAGNWTFCGTSQPATSYIDQRGRKWHSRQVAASGIRTQYGQARRVPKIADCRAVATPGKYRYVYALDAAMRARVALLAQPYPTQASEVQPAEQRIPSAGGGAIPTRTLHDEPDHV